MLHPLYRAQLLLALLPEWTGALVPVPGGNRPGRPSGHVISGVSIAGAGVVPYVDLPGRGIHFLLQGLTNGTRAGKLSDFGGRREEGDNDAFFTAARELCEETGFLFGDVEGIASSLRTSSTVRILNRQGRYVCYFLKVEYLPSAMVSSVDATSEEHASRELRWWHADELLGSVPEEQLLERMLTGADVANTDVPWQLGRSALRKGWLGNDSPHDDSPRDDSPRDSPRDRSPALEKRRRRAPEIAHEIALPDFDGFSP
ncbi:hypothetical protein Ctob_012386 [Chrysochromulina tobinii]|uniref:Nudix hydrolase domain-containing protein n=1 Tax=Chrysochromulina tobinii TaxID=1460289 RepID=A0A0M0JZ22_9EUKA|nr:hypothetical protein Ctob_012386 [Chrysochromulina tobinii]|eukprot:KOO31896.1 hypothetical protein Ctob_012386 [Chrysochromulina sp. CCMP291]